MSTFQTRFMEALRRRCDAPDAESAWPAWFHEVARDEGVDVSPGNVRRWMTGRRTPSPANMTRLAAILEVSEVWLSGGAAPDRAQDVEALLPGPLLHVAGLFRMSGARVTIGPCAAAEGASSLYVEMEGRRFAVDASIPIRKHDGGSAFPFARGGAADIRIGITQTRAGRLMVLDLTGLDVRSEGAVDMVDIGYAGSVPVTPGTAEPLCVVHGIPDLEKIVERFAPEGPVIV